jgi:hypothetical protein
VAARLAELYRLNGVVFGDDGSVTLAPGATPGLNVALPPSGLTLSGKVGERSYEVEVGPDGEVLDIWIQVTETFGKRKGTAFWSPIYGRERPRHAERKLRPVIEEAKAALARAAAASAN